MRGVGCDANARPPGQAYVTVDKKVDVLAEEAAKKARELEEAAIAKAGLDEGLPSFSLPFSFIRRIPICAAYSIDESQRALVYT